MKWRMLVLGLAIFVFSGVVSAKAGGNDIAGAVKDVVMKNLRATEAESMEAMMKTIHTQSPVYLSTKQQTKPLFANYDLRYELLSFKFIGIDGRYAVARVKQRTTKKSGPAFRNNEIDMLPVFRKEKGQWKYWNQVILEINYLK